ncbi:MAG: YtxH domain-containing protein [Arcicella sp.]|nr:YtxH domain-containing protein [Arcicella sp.]
MTKNSSVVLGIVTAAVAGAVIGMLFAPDKGTELREKVRGTVNDLASDFLDAIKNKRDQYGNIGEDVKDAAQNFKSKAVGKYAEVKDQVETGMENAKDKAQTYA